MCNSYYEDHLKIINAILDEKPSQRITGELAQMNGKPSQNSRQPLRVEEDQSSEGGVTSIGRTETNLDDYDLESNINEKIAAGMQCKTDTTQDSVECRIY